MSREVSFRPVVSFVDDTGQDPSKEVDLSYIIKAVGGVLCDSFDLGPAETAKTVTLPDTNFVLVASRNDERFTMRLRTGEEPLSNAVCVMIGGAKAATATLAAGDIELDGNGEAIAKIEVWAVRLGSSS